MTKKEFKKYCHTFERHTFKWKAQKLTLNPEYYDQTHCIVNWFGTMFFVNESLEYVPAKSLINQAIPLDKNVWWHQFVTPTRLSYSGDTLVNLTKIERIAAKKIADQIKKNPFYSLTEEQKK